MQKRPEGVPRYRSGPYGASNSKVKMIKKFGDMVITIRCLAQSDLKWPERFQDYVNSLIEEEAKILMKTKKTEKEEKKWLKERVDSIRKGKSVSLVAEHNKIVVGVASIDLERERQSHIGDFSISVRSGYRGIGLGTCLIKEVLGLARKDLKPKPRIIRLGVFANNAPAINLYKKMGFRQVAKIPDQLEFQKKLIDEIIMLLYL